MNAEPMAARRRMILVLGMHRSGTSAVAGTLSHLGVDFSERLVEATQDNPKGFFEHADVWQLDHEVLEALGSQWDDALPLPNGWRQQDFLDQATPRARAILQRDFADSPLPGIKDPRMCRLVSAWRDWLMQEGLSPGVVMVIRRPAEVIASLGKRDRLSADQAAWVWLRHVLEAEAATRDLPRVVVAYEKLLANWRGEVGRMALELNVVWPRSPDAVGPEIDAFLEPTLRHNRNDSASMIVSARLKEWLDRGYAALAVADTSALDIISAEVANADAVGAVGADGLRGARRHNHQLQGNLRWSEVERHEQALGNAELRDNLAHHADEVAAMGQGNAQLRENLERHVKELADTKEGNALLRENLDRHVKELADTRKWNAQLRESLDRHIGEIMDVKEGNAHLRETIELHVGEREQSEQYNMALREEVAHHMGRSAHTAGELDDAMAENARINALLEQVNAKQAQLASELASVYASRSWSVTAPMRGMIRLIRRGPTLPPAAAATPATPIELTAAEPAAAESNDMSTRFPATQPVITHADPVFAAGASPRVLIVTPDILGPIRNGGIGTAFAALAQTLAQAGHAVTILYTLGGHTEDGGPIERWVRHYAALGIRFVPVWLEQGEPVLDGPHHAWRAYRVYLWLKQHQGDYDLGYFPEWKGEAYYALQSKRLGLDFARLRMIVVTHSSTTWAESGNYVVPQKFDDLLLEFLERRSTEMADVVISPSEYMVRWMKQQGWRLPRPVQVIQNLMPDTQPEVMQASARAFTIVEWVFFGRLEQRKGLLIFLDALALMPEEVRKRIQITFLGKAVVTPQFDCVAVIREKLSGWSRPAKLIMDHDRDQALGYLQQSGRVAVIASLVENSPYTVLECVLKRIPFIAADVGGIAELVHPDDRNRALFKPTPAGLAEILLALDGDRYAPPMPAVAAATTQQRWLDLQGQLSQQAPVEQIESDAPWPHITVCLVHYNRPALLAQAIDSLRVQTYDHFDVVLVDDGSPSAPAQEYLDSLAVEFARRDWSIIRQANAYLGAARNTAVRHARGDYVLFMDDDNIAKVHELAVFARAARYSDADILTTVSDVFSDGDGSPQPPEVTRQLWIPLGNAAGLGVFRNVFGDANALVRRSTFESLGGFTEDYGVGHEDWEFFARASLAGVNLQLVPEPLFWYRVNASSMLRAGRAHIDHARSVRPYSEGLPDGIGAVLAYASYMHRHPMQHVVTQVATNYIAPGRRWVRASREILRPHVRARFAELLREHGWCVTVFRALRYIRSSRGRHGS